VYAVLHSRRGNHTHQRPLRIDCSMIRCIEEITDGLMTITSKASGCSFNQTIRRSERHGIRKSICGASVRALENQ